MKPFDLEKAKSGAPVQTRDGRPARILCFDRKGALNPIVALVTEKDRELAYVYGEDGSYDTEPSDRDLVMAPVIKQGWVYVFRNPSSPGRHVSVTTYPTADEAKNTGKYTHGFNYVGIAKIEWEE